ncbi:unnamed protein product [Sphagnum jensenii]|uniref:CST complex subunit CTC1 n=1 Tax=Sphagnum jensenii TaxID=128206 RepID=A0ABP1C4S6_9BRYO
MANIQMDLRNSRMTNLNKRPDAKYQEGGFEVSNADLDNSPTGNRVDTGCSIRCSILHMGHFYLLPILQSEPPTCTNLKNSLQLAKLTVGASCPLLSLAWSFSEDGHPCRTNAVATDSLEIISGQKLPKLYCLLEQAFQKPPGYNNNTVTDIYAHGRSASGIITRCKCNSGTTVQQCWDMRHLNACTAVLDEYTQVQDVVLMVGKTLQKHFRNFLTKLKAQAVAQLLSVREALDCASHPVKTVSDSLSNHEEASENKSDPGIGANSAGIFALQGALVSVCGQIKVHCNFEKYVCPVGLGPGVIACFRHILQRSPNVQLQSLPTTLIEVHSIRERLPVFSQGAQMNNLLTALAKHQRRPVDLLDCPKKLDLLSDLVNPTDISGRYLRLHCRVVGVQNLDLQWQGSLSFQSAGLDYDWLSMNCQEMLHCVSVTLGCFTIDDGSSVADCWATGQVATELLGFPSLFEKTQAQLQIVTSRIFPVLKQGSEMEASLDQVLCMLVHCHGRITVETEGLQAETGNMLWLVKGADGNTLQEDEGVILKVIMQQACQISSLVLECSALSIEEKMEIDTGEKRVPTSTLALING